MQDITRIASLIEGKAPAYIALSDKVWDLAELRYQEEKSVQAQIEALGKKVEDLKAEEAELVVDIEQHHAEGEAAKQEAAASAKALVEDAKVKADAIVSAAHDEAAATRKQADEDAQASLANVTAAIEAKALVLSELILIRCVQAQLDPMQPWNLCRFVHDLSHNGI